MVSHEELAITEWRFAWDGSSPNITAHPLFFRPIQNLINKFNHIPFYIIISSDYGKSYKARFPKNFNNSSIKIYFDKNHKEYIETYEKLMDKTKEYLEKYKYLVKNESKFIEADEWMYLGELIEKNLSLYLYTQPECLEHMGEELIGLLKTQYPEDEANKIFNELTNMPDTLITERNLDLLKIKKMILSPNFNEELYNHFWKYRSFYMTKLGSSIDEDLMLLIENFHIALETKPSLAGPLSSFSINREIRELSERMKSLGIIRFKGKNIWMNLVLTVFNLFETIASQICVKKEEMEKWTFDEVHYTLKNNKRPEKFDLKDTDECIVGIDNNEIVFLEAKESLVRSILSVGGKNIKGKCAYPGKVIGTVFKLTFHDNYIERLKDMKLVNNPILITSQTTPREIVFIKKSRGIITDEGGILSHAAIVAREYKIPTLIGTNHATTFFKNGDKIVLDADREIAYHRTDDSPSNEINNL